MGENRLTAFLRSIGLAAPAVPTYGAQAAGPQLQPSPSAARSPSSAPAGRQAHPAPTDMFFRIEDAKAVLGADVDPTPKFKDVEPGAVDTRFISCTWSTADGVRYANVSVREALTPAGADDNRGQFKGQRTSDAVPITGIGDEAYWDTPNGQILALVGDELLLVSTGAKGQALATRSRTQTEELARLVLARPAG